MKTNSNNNTNSFGANSLIMLFIGETVIMSIFFFVALFLGYYKEALIGLAIVFFYILPALLYYIIMKIYPFLKSVFKKQ